MNVFANIFADFSGNRTRKVSHKRNRKTSRKYSHITQRMICSPHSIHQRTKNARSINDTCYTPAILEYIKREYNKSHTKSIRETDPVLIWRELDKRLSHCSTEDCWLNQIRDEKLRKKIDRYIFAPDKPYEWKRNPTEWLSNYDILNVLEQYETIYPNFEFIGPTPIDFDTRLEQAQNPYDIGNETALPKTSQRKCVWNDLCHFSLAKKLREKKTKIGIIFNLDKHNQDGSHWVSMFIDIPRKFMFYFDSAGGSMPDEIRALVDRIHAQSRELGLRLKEITNGNMAHQRGNTECGMYSLFFIITMLTGKHTLTGKRIPFRKVMRMFLHERIPDKMMEEYRDEYFNG